jgi:hypothetical protein
MMTLFLAFKELGIIKKWILKIIKNFMPKWVNTLIWQSIASTSSRDLTESMWSLSPTTSYSINSIFGRHNMKKPNHREWIFMRKLITFWTKWMILKKKIYKCYSQELIIDWDIISLISYVLIHNSSSSPSKMLF